MGRTITGYEKKKTHEFMDVKRSKKQTSKKKKKNLSKWGKSAIENEKIQIDTFELRSPRDHIYQTELQWE